MTDTDDPTDGRSSSGRTTTAEGGSQFHSTRRDFLRSASAGTGALALGAAATGSAGAAQGDGPGQEIGTPRLEVDGNVLVDPDGNTITLRGLNVADPKLLDVTATARGKTAEQAIRYLTNREEGWYPRIVRLPVEPGNVAELTPVPLADYETGDYPVGEFDRADLEAYCTEHLDDVVDLCAQRNVYCIVDYHRHWGDGNQQWNDPDLGPEVELFWDVVAERYGEDDHVLFELYNEPTQPGMWGDPKNDHWAETWFEWVGVAQPWLETIREHTDTVVFIGSPSWTQSPEGALLTPETTVSWLQEEFQQFEDPAENIGFTYHIYPQHKVSRQQAWDDPSINGGGVDHVYEEYPLLVTEFGWDGELDGQYQYSSPFYPLEGTTEEFGDAFVNWLESSDAISWTAWCADPIWKPVMIERTFTERTQFDDVDAVGDPYGGEVPVYCEEPPCEWGVLGGDVGDPDLKSGESIRSTLEDLRDHNVPPVPDGEPTAPASPSGVTTDATETTIELAWESVPDADHYNVYRDGTPAAEPPSTTYTLTGLSADTTYAIGLEAENDAGTSGREAFEVTTEPGDGTSSCGDADLPADQVAEVDGQTVCDVDGDGYYRDVNGDGSVGQGDVAEFFTKQHRSAWKQPGLFDFSGNDAVTHGDVVELFDYVALQS